MQLLLALDWGTEPWSGQSPRSLTKAGLRDVDKSRTLAQAARRDDWAGDPRQLTLWIHQGESASLYKEVLL